MQLRAWKNTKTKSVIKNTKKKYGYKEGAEKFYLFKVIGPEVSKWNCINQTYNLELEKIP